jgi:hypothetical protein
VPAALTGGTFPGGASQRVHSAPAHHLVATPESSVRPLRPLIGLVPDIGVRLPAVMTLTGRADGAMGLEGYGCRRRSFDSWACRRRWGFEAHEEAQGAMSWSSSATKPGGDDVPWRWADASNIDTIDLAGLPRGPHKIRVVLVDANHEPFPGQSKAVRLHDTDRCAPVVRAPSRAVPRSPGPDARQSLTRIRPSDMRAVQTPVLAAPIQTSWCNENRQHVTSWRRLVPSS